MDRSAFASVIIALSVSCNLFWSRAATAQEAAAGIAETRAKEAMSKLEGSLSTPGSRVRGRFLERTPGDYVFAPEDRTLPNLPVENPQHVGTLALGVLVQVNGFVRAGKMNVREYELTETAEVIDTIAARGGARTVSADALDTALSAAEEISEELNRAIQPGAMSVGDRVLRTSSLIGNSVKDYVKAYREALEVGDEDQVISIVALWAEVRADTVDVLSDGSEYKALYNQPELYAPWRYERIYADSAAVVAIGEPGQDRPFCSGVLVAKDLILTAAHCFAQNEPGDLEVWFNYAEGPKGPIGQPTRRRIAKDPVAPAKEKWPKLVEREFSSTLYDYAIVRIVAPAAGENPAPSGARPQCLRSAAPDRNDALYVVGYPRGDRAKVHDNGRVEFPYRVRQGTDFDLLRLQVHTDFRDSSEKEMKEVLKEFDDSYILDTSGPTFMRYYYLFHIRDGGQPRMGIAVDTFQGNSGGPVFEHEGPQCVVGIMNSGMPDTKARLQVNWRVHERVLPARAILDDLARDPSTASVRHELQIDRRKEE